MTSSTLPATGTTAAQISFPWARILLLALAVFATVTTEMLPAGVLPELAEDLDIGLSTAGVLLSSWAVTIAVASVPLVRLLDRIDRRTILIAALAALALANLGLVLAPGFAVAVAFRVAAAAAHGVFWSVVMVYASAIAPASQVGRAVAVASAGATAALLVGIPAGTAVGQLAGWRVGFVVLAVVMTLTAAAIRLTLPRRPAPVRPAVVPGVGRDGTIVAVLVIAFVQFLVAFAQFAVFSYVAPFLVQAGFTPESVSPLLFAFGIGGLGGLALATLAADRIPRAGLLLALAAFAGALLVAALGGDGPVLVAGLVVWGAAMGALPPLLIGRTLRVASDRFRALASAIAVVAFNLGIGGGAVAGGILVDTAGVATTPVLGVALAGAALVVTAASMRRRRGPDDPAVDLGSRCRVVGREVG